MMTEEEKEKALEALRLEELHAFRRLRIGGPVIGHFSHLQKLRAAQKAAAPVTLRPYSCGYFNSQTGTFSPYPT